MKPNSQTHNNDRPFDFIQFLEDVKNSPFYAGQIEHIHIVPRRKAKFADSQKSLPLPIELALAKRGIGRLYSHQAEAIDWLNTGKNPLVVTGTSSGKSLCYIIPILTMLSENDGNALLIFPTKALCQNQFHIFQTYLDDAEIKGKLCGIYDSDTPSDTRRRLRDHASVIFTNPDMLHASLLPQHARWASYLSKLKLIVLDEMHTYSGIFGSNVANLFRRFNRILDHYNSCPQIMGCSATIGNPVALGEKLTNRKMQLIDNDGSPRGKRIYLFWNPPIIRDTQTKSRRSANVEAHELMTNLIQNKVPTITFSKARVTAEMIYKYVCERLSKNTPNLANKVSPYRGGYLAEDRREIERKLFNGDLLGISSTRALELGIDIDSLDASILVGYPGTLASFFQQSGRAGRGNRDSLVILVGLDTSINQYIMKHPDYIFGRAIEESTIDPDNPFVVMAHIRCAAHEIPISNAEINGFGPHARLALEVLKENLKIENIGDTWYHSSSEIPQHEISLRDYGEANVVIEDISTSAIIGEVDRFDAPPILHPGAIYIHKGETYRVLDLDMKRNIAYVTPENVDYYTQPLGGTDVHHIDNQLREKQFGSGNAYWGEVTAYYRTYAYEKIHFYTLDPLSIHGVDLPLTALETSAFWIVPPQYLMKEVVDAGLDPMSGLRGIGYATKMLLPLFMTCDTLDFSHTVGACNSPWNAIFIYERYLHGLGFTAKAFERLHEIMPVVLANIKSCQCEHGCPCCVGKPLRQYTVDNVELGEGSIPSKEAAIMILEGLLGDYSKLNNNEISALSSDKEAHRIRQQQALRRRLESGREPQLFHTINPAIKTDYPEIEAQDKLSVTDAGRRIEKRSAFDRELRKRLSRKAEDGNALSQLINDDCNSISGEVAFATNNERKSDQPPLDCDNSTAARAMRIVRKHNKGNTQ